MTALLPYLQTLLAIGNLCIMLWALKTFLNKPQTTLNEKLVNLEKEIARLTLFVEELKRSLDNSHEKHREQKQTNEMFITCMLAFIDYEIAFCQSTKYEHTEDLIRAKETLQKYLASK